MRFSGIDLKTEKTLDNLYNRIAKKTENISEYIFEKGNEFEVSFSEGRVYVSYTSDSEMYRSLLLGVYLSDKGENLRIKEALQFDNAGVMLDMSRGGVMTTDALKEYMEYMALMGLNSLMLYMEDVYEVPGYEYFGYMRGRYSKDELKQIDEYGKSLNIEVIPCIQTLGHYEQYIKWTEGKKMSDTNTVLMIGDDATYQFIEAIIKTVSECFTTKKIHIGMDEAWGMGKGNYLAKNGLRDGTELFCEHIEKVKRIADKYGLESMIWSDMFFRFASDSHGYYDENVSDVSKAKPLVPQDVSLVYWDYYHKDEKTYEDMIKKHKQITDKIVFAGGIWLWRGHIPDYRFTFDTTDAALNVCKNNAVKDVYATVWGDDGCETDAFFSLVGCAHYGEHMYNSKVDYEAFSERVKILFGAELSDFKKMTDVLYPKEKFEMGKGALCVKQILYSDILCGFIDAEINDEKLVSYYKELADSYEKLMNTGAYFDKHYEYVKDVCTVAYRKIDAINKLHKYYKKDNGKLKEVLSLLAKLYDDYQKLKNSHYELWCHSYKPFGFENIDGRYGIKISRVQTAQRRVSDYLEGKIESLPELEEKRLPFNGNMVFATTHNALTSGFFSRGY